MMRKLFWAVLLILGIGAAYFFLPGFLKGKLEKGLEKALPGSQVSIGRLSIGTDLVLDVYDPVLVLKALPKESNKSASIPLRGLRIHGLALKANVGTVSAEAKGELSYDFKASRFTLANLTIPSFKAGELLLKNIVLKIGEDGSGKLTVDSITQQKLKLSNLSARAELDRETLKLSGLEVSFAGGKITGIAGLHFTNPVSYTADLSIGRMDLSVLAKDLEIEAKVGLAGHVDGRIGLEGAAGGIQILKGGLSNTENGGDVVINDRTTLENLAQRVKQPLEVVESAFKEYHFDTASAGLSLKGHDLGLEVHLDGAKGKRDLDVTLHDFL